MKKEILRAVAGAALVGNQVGNIELRMSSLLVRNDTAARGQDWIISARSRKILLRSPISEVHLFQLNFLFGYLERILKYEFVQM